MPDYHDIQEKYRQVTERVLVQKLRPRWWFSRTLIYLHVLVAIVVVGMLEETSLTNIAMDRVGSLGWSVLYMVGIFCLMGLFDVVVNDVMPERFSFPLGLMLRPTSLLGIALGLGMMGVLVAYVHGFSALLLVYWMDAGLAGAMAFLDIFARYPRRLP